MPEGYALIIIPGAVRYRVYSYYKKRCQRLGKRRCVTALSFKLISFSLTYGSGRAISCRVWINVILGLIERENYMHDLIKKYLIATRPWSFPMSLISVSVGALLAARTGQVSWTWYALTAFGIVFFHAAANVINDYYDSLYGIDQEDSPTARYRPQPILSGMLTSRQLLWEAVILLVLASAVGIAASVMRSLYVLWIGVIGLFTSIFYTAGPVKFKYRAWGEFGVFMMWGPLMVEGAYAVQRNALSMEALYVSIPLGILVALVLFANNIRDIDYDSRHNIKTMGILLGARKSFLLFVGFIILAYAFIIGLMVSGIISLWGLLIFLSVPQAVLLLRAFKEKIPDKADAVTARFVTTFGLCLIVIIFLDGKFFA
jgi:1,4-dihydroxy-2-naphthoate octaprenyltransferase